MQTYPMDLVIKSVEDHEDATSSSYAKVILVDIKTRAVVQKKGWFSPVRRYVVSNSNNPNAFSEGKVSYKLRSLDYEIPLTLSFSARCKPGNEARAAQALFDVSDSPGMVLERYVAKWLGELSNSDIPGFVNRCLTNRAGVQESIAQKALAETALDLIVRVVLEPEGLLKPTTVDKHQVAAPVRDYEDEKQHFDVFAELLIDEANSLPAVLSKVTDKQIEQIVEQKAVEYVHQQVDLRTFCTALNTAPVRQALTAELNSALAGYGRKVGLLRLEAHPPKFEVRFQDEYTVVCHLHNYAKEVKIQSKVQMLIEDVAKYRSHKSPDLKPWLQERLKRYVPQILFRAGYIDVLLRFGTYEQQIKDALTAEAQRIGYRIEHLITGPDLPPIKLKEPFPVDVTGSFETSLSEFYVDVKFVVTCRIPKLDSVEMYLSREEDVPKLIGEHILAVARQTLHAVDPQRFHTRFNYSKDGEVTVEQELIGAIETGLKDKFKAEVFRVVIKVVETELWSRLKKLQQTISPFVVEMQSVHGDEPLVFRGNFQVEKVDSQGWHRFQNSTSGVEEIRKQVEDHILSEFHTLTPNQIQYRSPRHRKELESILKGVAERFVRETFGLVIRVTNVRREPTPQELAANRLRLREREESLRVDETFLTDWAEGEISASHERRARLTGLLEQRKLLAAQTGTEDELAELDARIGIAREQLSIKRVPSPDEVQQKLLPPPKEDVSLSDFAALMGVPEAKLPDPSRQLAAPAEGETE